MTERELFSTGNEQASNSPRANQAPAEIGSDFEPAGDQLELLPDPPTHYRVMKRLIDIVGSVVMMAAVAPLLLLIAVAIKFTSEGPVLFPQKRVGYKGKIFNMLKFRTMRLDEDPQAHKEYVTQLISGKYGAAGEQPLYKLVHDPRITPLGRFLRRTSLDELPQFWNVLCGDMSLVGPRPPIPFELTAYQPWLKQRLSVKPGITGLWQIKGRSRTTFDEMVELDIAYIMHPSILLDLRILVTTPKAAIRGDKAF